MRETLRFPAVLAADEIEAANLAGNPRFGQCQDILDGHAAPLRVIDTRRFFSVSDRGNMNRTNISLPWRMRARQESH